MAEYLYENLSGVPSEAHLYQYVQASSMSNKEFEVSRNASEAWMKAWFDPALSSEDKALFDGFVEQSLNKDKQAILSGSEYFELVLEAKKWTRHRRRVAFSRVFAMIPTVTVSNAVFDGAADLTIVRVTKKFFDFVVEARGSKKTDGLTTISFDWEAME